MLLIEHDATCNMQHVTRNMQHSTVIMYHDISFSKKLFGAMHFIYYINRSIATKLYSLFLAIDQQHTTYMFYGEPWARTGDIEITKSVS